MQVSLLKRLLHNIGNTPKIADSQSRPLRVYIKHTRKQKHTRSVACTCLMVTPKYKAPGDAAATAATAIHS